MRKLLKTLTSRMAVIVTLLLAQFATILLLLLYAVDIFPYLFIVFYLITAVVAIGIINSNLVPEYKNLWLFFLLISNVYGVVIYLIFGLYKRKLTRIKIVSQKNKEYGEKLIKENRENVDVEKEFPNFAHISKYLTTTDCYPVYYSEGVDYYADGILFFEALKNELKKAKKTIFMEYFIVGEGRLFDELWEILEEKILQGVDVRIIFDDLGSLKTLRKKKIKELQEKGLKVLPFNVFKPIINIQLNNRTHRKMTIIDGTVAFVGGYNIADEYANYITRFGYWKDTGAIIRGCAVNSLTRMFLTFWGIKYKVEGDYSDYFFPYGDNKSSNSFVQPFSDNPIELANLSKNVFLQAIASAKKYIYFTTPYLIIDHALKVAFKNAVHAGVEVKIFIPHVPDKKMVFELTKAFATELVEVGVKVYEFEPGFLHAKGFVADDELSYVGSSNLDYRSLHMHFENGALFFDREFALKVKEDMLDTEKKSLEFKREMIKTTKLQRMKRSILRLFGPLL